MSIPVSTLGPLPVPNTSNTPEPGPGAIVPFDASFSSMIESYEESQVEERKSLNAANFVWNATHVVSLIRAYESYPCLWNTQYTEYKRVSVKASAWMEISDYFQLPVLDIKRKMSNLINSYRRERVRVESKKNEKVPYESQLYFYRHFAFMDRVYQPKAFKMSVGGPATSQLALTDDGINIKSEYNTDEANMRLKVRFRDNLLKGQSLILLCPGNKILYAQCYNHKSPFKALQVV
uniref:MADF domain-containing protein n=1 Tax=Cacopsylla melanoneura TaxID=428564 RepID=A0A8D8Q166_9HEMI